MTIVVDSDRKKPTGAVATAPEAEALFRSMAAYAGTYTVKGIQVIHRPDASWNETWTGTDQVRNFKFEGDLLSLATAASPNPYTNKMSVRTSSGRKLNSISGHVSGEGLMSAFFPTWVGQYVRNLMKLERSDVAASVYNSDHGGWMGRPTLLYYRNRNIGKSWTTNPNRREQRGVLHRSAAPCPL